MSAFDEQLKQYKLSSTPEAKAVRQFRLEIDLAEMTGFIVGQANTFRSHLVEGAVVHTPEGLDLAVAGYIRFLWDQASLAMFVRAGGCERCGKQRPPDFKGCRDPACPFNTDPAAA